MILKRFGRDLNIQKLYYCTKNVDKKKLYSSTILLPKTKFPFKHENDKLIERDVKISNLADFDQLYTWQRGHLSEPEFVLHDGPPYANGKPHMGHAINKILKDTILRFQLLKGNKVHYVPGWDCHGLPIELKAVSTANSTPLEIRSKARNFVKKTIDKQMEVFKSWGVIGDWTNYYATYNPNYVKVQFKLFHKLYKKGLIYRDIKPIHWSPSSRTALAEAELEYCDDHVSPSAFVRFKINHMPNKDCQNLYALIWTTTPWTLPANQAVCFSPTSQYSIVKNSKDNSFYIVATELIESLSKSFNCTLEIVENFIGSSLSNCTYIHPVVKGRVLKFLASNHATVSKGTGLVHTAPAHGHEDFLLTLSNKMPIDNLVDDLGCYNKQAGAELEGKFVLGEGTDKVLQIIGENVIHLDKFVHSYPYDWRTKKPVIIRASEQWFIDTNALKNKAIEALEDVRIIPASSGEKYKRHLISQVQKRPYWCISRQRKWGVPIPVFLDKTDNSVIINEDIIRHICELVDNHGTDFWWNFPPEQLIPENSVSGLNMENIEKGQDILDIWFDSGVSWANALEGDKVADMYLEGVDQFNGWFQSSLITSVALRDKAPYKSIYVHGFAVDENGLKMSKSVGNVVDPVELVRGGKSKKPYGIDTLRWWVACHANQDAVAHINTNVLQSSVDEIQKIRSVLRFALGCLSDYPIATKIEYDSLPFLDKYMLHMLHQFHTQMQEAIDDHQFNKICIAVINLLTNSVSALYYTGIKDRLYCDPENSFTRRSAQFVLLQIFEIVSQSVAPIIPHMIEEMYHHLPQKTGKTYFQSVHNAPEDTWRNFDVVKLMNIVLSVKRVINKSMGTNPLNAVVTIEFSPTVWKLIQACVGNEADFRKDLEDIFQVSQVKVIIKPELKNDYNVETGTSERFSCIRCRRVQSISEDKLCERCDQIVKELNPPTVAAVGL